MTLEFTASRPRERSGEPIHSRSTHGAANGKKIRGQGDQARITISSGRCFSPGLRAQVHDRAELDERGDEEE